MDKLRLSLTQDIEKILRTKGERGMKTKTQKVLPKTAGEIQNGGIYTQAVRCGKSNCKCSKGEFHSALYFFARRNGKLTKTYVRKSEIETFTRLVILASLERRERRKITKTNFALLNELRQTLRDKQSYINSLRGN